MVVLHSVLALRRLRRLEAPAELGEDLCGVMFSDFDHNLREIGVGDLSVGKKVRKLAEAFYGRGKALDAALASAEPRAEVAKVLTRNVFVGTETGTALGLADYVIAADDALGLASLGDIVEGQLPFPRPSRVMDSRTANSARSRDGVAQGALDG